MFAASQQIPGTWPDEGLSLFTGFCSQKGRSDQCIRRLSSLRFILLYAYINGADFPGGDLKNIFSANQLLAMLHASSQIIRNKTVRRSIASLQADLFA
jgi:hypothetical protein